MAIFQKRLRCFYCGQRSADKGPEPIRKWRCKQCEAVNYLDENGDITDPPTTATNPQADGDAATTPFNLVEFDRSGLFCRKCVRNQHLFLNAIASYLPDIDDHAYLAYEREYPKFRKNLEERYPQVCDNCEARVNQRIRQAGYEAKADHLRRMMEQSKVSRAARKARDRNWRSLLVVVGALSYWTSIAGQLAWSFMGAIATDGFIPTAHPLLSLLSLISDMKQAVGMRHNHLFSNDLAPYAGLALIAGILSLWWNPKLRLKVEGRSGRFVGLAQYYQFQLTVLVTRFVVWALLKDPSTSGLKPSLPPTLHIFMIIFTMMSIVISRQIVQYDTRPLVLWSDYTPVASPSQNARSNSTQADIDEINRVFHGSSSQNGPQPFPVEKLAVPRQTPDKSPYLPSTPPPEEDTMDWTPSVKHDIRPKFTAAPEIQPNPVVEKSPFYGALPEVSRPLSWQLRNPRPQKPAGQVEKIIKENPFQRAPTQQPEQGNPIAEKNSMRGADAQFAPPKFFPPADYSAATGLESLFDQAFTIRSPDEKPSSQTGLDSRPILSASIRSQKSFIFQCIQVALLSGCLLMWQMRRMELVSIPGNCVEITALGSASLIAGFALLEILKKPRAHWNSMEILVSLTELAAAIQLGGSLPRGYYDRIYFDRCGLALLAFMSAQQLVWLSSGNTQAQAVTDTAASEPVSRTHSPIQTASHSRNNSQTISSIASSPPSLSFSSTLQTSSFSQPTLTHFQSPPPNYGLYRKDFMTDRFKDYDSDGSEVSGGDSDAETTVTSTTNRTIRHLDPFGLPNTMSTNKDRPGLGPGLQGLSLDDSPRRVARSQTTQAAGGETYRRYPLRSNR